MFDYIDKKLSAKEEHRVEKHVLHCDLCSDALEGLQLVKNRNRIETINQLIEEKFSKKKIIGIHYKTILSIAAGILVLIGSVFLFNFFNSKNFKNSNIADLQQPKENTILEKTEAQKPIAVNTFTTLTNKEETKKNEPDKNVLMQEKPNSPKTSNAENIKIINENSGLKNDERTIGGFAANDMAAAQPTTVATDKNNLFDGDGTDGSTTTREETVLTKSTKKSKDEKPVAASPAAMQEYNMAEKIKTNATYTQAQFVGGNDSLAKYIKQNFKYPNNMDAETSSNTKIYIQLLIDKNGTVKSAKILRGINTELDNEALRVVKNMPKWIPASKDGKTIETTITLPIQLQLK